MGFDRLASLPYLIILLLQAADNVIGFCYSATKCYKNNNNNLGADRRSKSSSFVLNASPNDDNSPPNNNEDSSSLDMNLLRQRMDHQQNQYAKLITEQSKYIQQTSPLPESVHIILFNPDTPNQNVHTLEIPKGSGNNMILAFEDGADCGMFAQNLRELEFVDPSPAETMFEPFKEFCESMSIPVMIVPAGFDLSPPQSNSKDRDDDDDEDDDDTLASISTLLEDEEIL
mmetsp:Transcript_15187/g.21560  ORF Transcript_15187/g.21560 Transcript_15187/m.21560 type:complete len:229 (-) Transcript_15187:1263-1949(-)